MQPWNILECLEDLAEKLKIDIVYENMGEEEFSVAGGLCKIKGSYKIFVDKSQSLENQIKIISQALSSFNTDGIYVLPLIREILEEAKK